MRVYIGFRLKVLDRQTNPLSLSPKLRFSLPWPPKPLARARGYVFCIMV